MPSKLRDPYEILGIPREASQEEIKTAYRNLAKKFHPDLNPGSKDAEKRFKEINSANALLGDPVTRAKYDAGEIDESGNAQAAPESDQPFYYETKRDGGRYATFYKGMENELFESLFRAAQERAAGEDHEYSLEIDFADSVLGAEREITLPDGKKLKVRIPAGIESGKKLRLKGLGGRRIIKKKMGDAYVQIKVRPSKLFRRVQRNLEIDLPITINEAIVGGEVRIPTLEGAVLLKIPAGSSSGDKLRVRGKGVGDPGSQDRGDLLVTLKIVLPSQIDSELAAAITRWSETHSYNPREHLDK